VRKILLFSLFFLLPVISFSQAVVGEWDSYTSVLNVRDVIVKDNYVYGASSGGLVEFDRSAQQFNTYTIRHGLTRNDIQCLAEDKFGRLWLGMSFPDGEINIWNAEAKTVEQIFSENVFGDKLTSISSIAFHGNAAFAAYQLNVDWGISYFKISGAKYNYKDRFESFPIEISEINSLTVIGDTLWVATNTGLLFADLNQIDLKPSSAWQNVDFPASGYSSNVVSYEGMILANLGSALFKIEGDQANLYNDSFTLDINSLITDNSGILYATTNGGVYRYFSGSWKNVLQGSTTKCVFDSNDVLWGGSDSKCLWTYFDETLRYYTPNTILDNIYTALWVNEDGCLMAGTQKGFSIQTPDGWYNICGKTNYISIHENNERDWDMFIADTIAYSLSSAGRIYNLVCRRDGHYFAPLYGSYQRYLRPGGLLEFDPDDLTNYEVYDTTDQKLAASAGKGGSDYYLGIGYIALDENDNLWIANQYAQNDNVIAVLTSDNHWVHFNITESYGYLNYHTTSIIFDNKGRVWFASEVHGGDSPSPAAGGIIVLDHNGTISDKSDDEWHWITTSDGLADNAVYSLAFDLEDNLWIMTSAGIQRAVVSPAVLTSVPFAKECRIKVDGLNNKWISTVGSGVKVYTHNGIWLNDVEGFTTVNSGILSNYVLDIAFDHDDGIVYLATNKGISIYKSPYAVFGDEYRELKIFPMPFEIPPTRPLIIDGLLQESDVKIITIDGTFVRHLSHLDGDIIGQQAFWDGKDHRGRYVGSGVYLCMAYTKDGDTTVGKIAVIRK
jgi:ligand-binding sensor domain-containing protein